METFGMRLRRLREERGLGVNQFGAALGKTGSYVTRIEKGQRQGGKLPPYDDLMAMARVLAVPIAVLAGSEEMVLPSRPRQLTEADLYERFGIRPYEQPVAIEGIAVSAGPGAGVPQGLDETIPRRVRGSKYLWEAPVIGDCMADEINPGELVIYSTRLGAEIGKVMVALRDEEELIIKRLRLAGEKQVLRPNHGKDVPVDERIRFLGRGVSVQRPLL